MMVVEVKAESDLHTTTAYPDVLDISHYNPTTCKRRTGFISASTIIGDILKFMYRIMSTI